MGIDKEDNDIILYLYLESFWWCGGMGGGREGWCRDSEERKFEDILPGINDKTFSSYLIG
jgi:hypothetical protein